VAVAGFRLVAVAGFALHILKCWWKLGMQEQHVLMLMLLQIHLLLLVHRSLARPSAEKVQLAVRSQTGWDRLSWARL